MTRSQRMLAAGLGAVAIALAVATPVAAAPSNPPSPSVPPSSPGSPTATPGSPSTRPAVTPSTSDKPATGTKQAAPRAAVYDMQVAGTADVTFVSNGPAKGLTTSVNLSVHNAGTVTQQGLTVVVSAPSDARLTGALIDAHGIDHCVRGVLPDGRDVVTCQVHDGGPGVGTFERAGFVLTGDVPLPARPAEPFGSVSLLGYHSPNASDSTGFEYRVHSLDTSKPSENMDLVTRAPTVTMSRGGDGLYHGVLRTSVTNRGGNAVPPMRFDLQTPAGVTLVGSADDGFPYPCVRSGDTVTIGTGVSCDIQQTLQPGRTFSSSWKLTAQQPVAGGRPGSVSANVFSDNAWGDPKGENDVAFTVTFASASASPSHNGQAGGGGSSLPVTGTPLALIVGGGAAVLAAGGALLVAARRRRAQSPNT